MDSSTTAIAYIGLAISVTTAIVGAINRKHIISKCCGRTADASFVIEDISPGKVDGNATDNSKSAPPP
jgi:hypothetical protein